MASITLIRMLSVRPPTKPAAAPTISPRIEPRNTETTPTCSERRAPYTTRERVSRPRWSVPIQCAALGGCSRSDRLIAAGS